jgi:hypothetical protein
MMCALVIGSARRAFPSGRESLMNSRRRSCRKGIFIILWTSLCVGCNTELLAPMNRHACSSIQGMGTRQMGLFSSLQGAGPGAADLDVDGRIVRAEGRVQADVDPILPRQFVAEPDAASHNRLGAVKTFEIVPRRAAAHESNQTEACPELPAQLGFPPALRRGGPAHGARTASAVRRECDLPLLVGGQRSDGRPGE